MRRGGQELNNGALAVVADPEPGERAEMAELLRQLDCRAVEAATGDEALEICRRQQPALVVLDVALRDGFAYEVCRRLREERGDTIAIVMTSEHRTDASDQVAGLLLGADDYVAKPLHAGLFLARVRRLVLRSRWRTSGQHGLTPRESEVLALLVDGMTTGEIAERLHITPKTAATHIERILPKLGAHSQAQAVAFAVRDHLVESPA